MNTLEETKQTKMEGKILLVDDEPDIVEFLSYNLEKEGYKVYSASNGLDALDIAKQITPDLIVLDVMMPGMDGIETCIELKEQPSLANSVIVFLTARSEDYSQIAGLDAGGDDYISKPIKPRLFVSKVKSLLRRKVHPSNQTIVEEVKGIKIDRERYSVEKEGKPIVFPKKEFELLALLVSKPGHVFTREHILSSVWGQDVIVSDRTIDVHIRKLREKLGDSYIKTIKGVGYKFEES